MGSMFFLQSPEFIFNFIRKLNHVELDSIVRGLQCVSYHRRNADRTYILQMIENSISSIFCFTDPIILPIFIRKLSSATITAVFRYYHNEKGFGNVQIKNIQQLQGLIVQYSAANISANKPCTHAIVNAVDIQLKVSNQHEVAIDLDWQQPSRILHGDRVAPRLKCVKMTEKDGEPMKIQHSECAVQYYGCIKHLKYDVTQCMPLMLFSARDIGSKMHCEIAKKANETERGRRKWNLWLYVANIQAVNKNGRYSFCKDGWPL